MRVIFMGTPVFAERVLQTLISGPHEIVAVYSQPPRPSGRGKKETPSPVHAAAAAAGLEVRTPINLKAPADRAALAALEADVAVVVAYGLLLPQAVLDAPRFGCLNLHASLLPRWRGAAPIQRAIMAGDSESGVCVMRMEAGLDTGPVLSRAATPIRPDDTAETLHDRLVEIGAPLMATTLEALAAGRADETPQPDEGVVYAHKIDKSEARIDWSLSAAELDRRIRGLSPFPGAWFEAGEPAERIKLLRATPEAGRSGAAPGAVLDAAGLIACGEGAVRLARVQRAGRGPSDADAFLRGFALAPGEKVA